MNNFNHYYFPAPPHAASDFGVSVVNSSSITLRWNYITHLHEQPDYYFTLQYSTGGTGRFIDVANISHEAPLTYTLKDLSPYTMYMIQLITRNGVSEQDNANVYLRTVSLSCQTSEEGTLLHIIDT